MAFWRRWYVAWWRGAAPEADRSEGSAEAYPDQTGVEIWTERGFDPPPDYTIEQIDAVLLTVPPFERRLFVLHRIDGLSYAEIARQNRISVRRVERAIVTALGYCRRAFREIDRRSGQPE